MAAFIHDLDQKANLTKLYDREIPDPVSAVFNTEKRAYADDIQLFSRAVSASKLASLPLSFFRDALGPDYAAELKGDRNATDPAKVAMIIPTLPSDLKRALETALRTPGI